MIESWSHGDANDVDIFMSTAKISKKDMFTNKNSDEELRKIISPENYIWKSSFDFIS